MEKDGGEDGVSNHMGALRDDSVPLVMPTLLLREDHVKHSIAEFCRPPSLCYHCYFLSASKAKKQTNKRC